MRSPLTQTRTPVTGPWIAQFLSLHSRPILPVPSTGAPHVSSGYKNIIKQAIGILFWLLIMQRRNLFSIIWIQTTIKYVVYDTKSQHLLSWNNLRPMKYAFGFFCVLWFCGNISSFQWPNVIYLPTPSPKLHYNKIQQDTNWMHTVIGMLQMKPNDQKEIVGYSWQLKVTQKSVSK